MHSIWGGKDIPGQLGSYTFRGPGGRDPTPISALSVAVLSQEYRLHGVGSECQWSSQPRPLSTSWGIQTSGGRAPTLIPYFNAAALFWAYRLRGAGSECQWSSRPLPAHSLLAGYEIQSCLPCPPWGMSTAMPLSRSQITCITGSYGSCFGHGADLFAPH